MGNAFRQTVAGIFSRHDMNQQLMLEGHLQATLQRAARSRGTYLLAVQDTTFYNYAGHKCLEGIGVLQGDIPGLVQHNTLLLDEQGLPLGLVDQQYWTRQGGKDLPQEVSESQKWHQGLQAVNQSLSGLDKRTVVIQDREADMWSLFKAPRAPQVDLLVRVHEPRHLEVVGQGYVGKLADVSAHLTDWGLLSVTIRRNNRDVQLQLRLRAGQINVRPRRDLSISRHQVKGLSLVVAQEIACTDEAGKSLFDPQQASVWYLLTSLPTDSVEAVQRVVRFYSFRWRVETFHYTLKSGALNVEKLQFDDIHTLMNALAFYSVVAWQLLALTLLARWDPQAPATTLLEAEEVALLGAVSGRKVETVSDYALALGRLVGFARSKKQPLPGVKVMAQAIERFYYIQLGAKGQRQATRSPDSKPLQD